VTWAERTNAQHQWLGGVLYEHGVFSAVGGYGYSAWSADGLTWTASTFRNAEAARTLATGGGVLMAATDPGNWWRSTDGKSWTLDSSGHGSSELVWCGTAFSTAAACTQTVARGDVAYGQGVWVRVSWDRIERSTNGTSWTSVLSSSNGLTGVAFGVVN